MAEDLQNQRGTGGQSNVHPRICMRHLGNHRRGNPLADWLCRFAQEKVKNDLGGKNGKQGV